MEKSKSPRKYPPMYEKLIPVSLGIIGMIVIVLLLITIAVALR